MNQDLNKIVKLALLSALSILLMLTIRFPIIPSAPFLEYEPGDVPALIGAFLYGPGAGLLITAAVFAVPGHHRQRGRRLDRSGDAYGRHRHHGFGGSALLQEGTHFFKGAVLALAAGTLGMTLIMIPLNLYFTTKFLEYPLRR